MAAPPHRHPKPPPFLTVVSGGAPVSVDARPSPPVPSAPETPMVLASGTDSRHSPRRDAQALTELYEEHNPWVLKRLFRYGVRNPADLEEQATRVWEIVIRKYADFRGEAAVTTWLSEICRCVASDFRHLAWQWRIQHTPEGETPEQPPDPSDCDRVVNVIDALSLLRELPPNLRDVLVLFYVENRTANDIGLTLGTSQRAVYGLIEKGLARLQEVIRNRRQETP